MKHICILILTCIEVVYGTNLFRKNEYKFTHWKHYSGISPYFESNQEQLNPQLDRTCQINKSIYLIRHGRIVVDDYDYFNVIRPFLKRLNQLKQVEQLNKNSRLNFLLNWQSPFANETVEQMTQLGLIESYQFGIELSLKHKDFFLFNRTTKYRIWAAASQRTKQTAEQILRGLFHSTNVNETELISISEDKHRGTNSLTPTKTCHSFRPSDGSKQANTWLKFYSKSILKRLNSELKHFRLTHGDIFAMQQICAYEFNLKEFSSFCSLFTIEDTLAFEYYFDIKYHYEIGYGNRLTPYLAIHWLKSISNLFNQSKQNVYLTVVHREMLSIVLVTLGLFNQTNDFPLNEIDWHRPFRSSWFLSFLSRIEFQLFSCSNEKFIRILSNNKVLPIPSCSQGIYFSCPFKLFLHYIDQRFQQYRHFNQICQLNSNETFSRIDFYD